MPAPLTLENLNNDLDELARLLERELPNRPSLDAYLLSAGINQITEDHLHPEIYPFDRAANYLAEQGAVGRVAGRGAAVLAGTGRRIARRQRAARRVLRWQREMGRLVEALAAEAAAGAPSATAHALPPMEGLPVGLRRKMIRLPACFQSFDQQPSDVARLAQDFGSRWPLRSRPLLVVGVRTSGSYLAPLCAAFLRAEGYEQVDVLTMRPGYPLLTHERELLRSLASEKGLALVIDDPPVTGSGVDACARELERGGFAPESIVLLLQVFGVGLPPRLDRYPAVVLPWDEWAVSARLTPEAVERDLSALAGPGAAVLEVNPLSPARRTRGHTRALFRVRTGRPSEGSEVEGTVAVEGVGVGYFGSPPVVSSRVLEKRSPKLLGVRAGLLYREWLPDERRVGAAGAIEPSVARSIAKYVSDRGRALPVPEDTSLRMVGDLPAWEVASTIVSGAFGRAWPLAKVLVVDRIVKRLLRVDHPSVVDGRTDLDRWFYAGRPDEPLVKVHPPEGPFSNLGLSCFDPAFDLAGATAQAGEPSFARRLRSAYATLGNAPVDEERLLLYELGHLWRRRREHEAAEPELRRARSRAIQRYFAELYLQDVEAAPSGPLCALDVDGVLETEHLGFPAITPAAARTLRALMLHGYRPVLVSGRSLDEIRERCHVYGLAGGVAEYGAACVSGEGQVSEHLPDGAATELQQLRVALSSVEGVRLDPDYRLAVRADRLDAHGLRKGLARETISACLEKAGSDHIRPIPGEAQTDFMVDGVDKATGMRRLADMLGVEADGPGVKPFALAVGDTAADIPFAGVATLACAPAHESANLRQAGFEIMRAPYQAGLAQAAARLLGHPPGGCSVCRPPTFTRERRLLLTALGAQERGRRTTAVQGIKLVMGTG